MGYVSSLKSADNVTNAFYIYKYCWKHWWGKQKFVCLFNGEANWVICAFGKKGVFYTSALNAFKKEFGNQYTVSHIL